MMKISEQEFRTFADYIHRISGVYLQPEKQYLVEARLSPLLKRFHCATFSELYYKLKTDLSDTLKESIINAITTRETLFFRDQAPFELLQYKIIPELIDYKKQAGNIFHSSRKIPIRILSAACSTGQEVYSIAITLDKTIPDLNQYDIQILGTDISDEAIAAASYGHYNDFEVSRGLNEETLTEYFSRDNAKWKISDRIRSMCTFQKINLISEIHKLDKYDIIFCRNLAIYFNQTQKQKIFDHFARILYPHGALIIGASEYLAGISDRFYPRRHLKSVYYSLNPQVQQTHNTNRSLPLEIQARS